ncbi:hypothetical protein E3N88_00448 [Mikania micrantha]|uniref:Uncharacterized protein n=1 Tax=Mikania micrantha TaxID=192012 RepID=A0A5N6PYH1_9ASTR|nr:hypothetical protein E3N88_00448 [Mikania micrantha]
MSREPEANVKDMDQNLRIRLKLPAVEMEEPQSPLFLRRTQPPVTTDSGYKTKSPGVIVAGADDSPELLDVRGILEEEIDHGWLKVAGVAGVVGDGACNWNCCSLSACFLTIEQGETHSSVCWICEKRVQKTRRGGTGVIVVRWELAGKEAGRWCGQCRSCLLSFGSRSEEHTHRV